ncbi:hypothetical protein PPL_00441 [Heterostelium album PN500]|uniref:Uncharacterized protein n=1 Tax=Heterostelium pallidum (strain ATCC 26659 / Pp 5 / PN500) TaxID=670386 RepID=D3AWG7_HETP5|nr:hypothetical protein PPL_00441 [Heterostelium album PN500]EFA86640.1 hypothetical protein PPL_00441 [Heterostelium album PN500]|eukprot:XP_020438745.1 hypothetical protein PPL_00441 [Heterostelium album PN500]
MSSKIQIFCLFFLFGIFNAIFGQHCMKCAEINSSCDPSNRPKIKKYLIDFHFTDFSACANGTLCLNSKCMTLPDLGGDCSVTKRCLGELSCNNNKCVSENYLGYGENCTKDDDCSGHLTCTGGVCANGQYPKCDSREECKVGEACYQDACIAPLDDGKECNSNDQCQILSSCLGTPKICTMPLTAVEGGVCDDLTDCDFTKNLLCIDNKCVSISSIEAKNCSSGNDCPHDTYCVCNPDSTTGMCKSSRTFDGITKEKYIIYVDCMRNSKCPYVDDITKESCIYKRCGADPLENSKNMKCKSSGGSSSSSSGTSHYHNLIRSDKLNPPPFSGFKKFQSNDEC